MNFNHWFTIINHNNHKHASNYVYNGQIHLTSDYVHLCSVLFVVIPYYQPSSTINIHQLTAVTPSKHLNVVLMNWRVHPQELSIGLCCRCFQVVPGSRFQLRLRVQSSLVQTGLEECDLRGSTSCSSWRSVNWLVTEYQTPRSTRKTHRFKRKSLPTSTHIQPSNLAYPPSHWTYLPSQMDHTTTNSPVAATPHQVGKVLLCP